MKILCDDVNGSAETRSTRWADAQAVLASLTGPLVIDGKATAVAASTLFRFGFVPRDGADMPTLFLAIDAPAHDGFDLAYVRRRVAAVS